MRLYLELLVQQGPVAAQSPYNTFVGHSILLKKWEIKIKREIYDEIDKQRFSWCVTYIKKTFFVVSQKLYWHSYLLVAVWSVISDSFDRYHFS